MKCKRHILISFSHANNIHDRNVFENSLTFEPVDDQPTALSLSLSPQTPNFLGKNDDRRQSALSEPSEEYALCNLT